MIPSGAVLLFCLFFRADASQISDPAVLRFPFPGSLAFEAGEPAALAEKICVAPPGLFGAAVFPRLCRDCPDEDGGEEPAVDEALYYSWAVAMQVGYAASTGIDEVLLGSAPRHRGDVYPGVSVLYQCRPFDFHGVGLRFELELNQSLVLESARDKRPFGQTDAFFSLRYLGEGLPWSDSVASSVALGEGASYNWKISDVELQRNGARDVGNLLNFVMLEFAAKKPRSRCSLYFRIAHRSGGSGYLAEGDVVHGSNVLLLGLRIDLGKPISGPRGTTPSW